MKHLLAVGVLVGAAANEAWAQGTEIYTRWGPSGSQVVLPPATQTFNYEATVSGVSVPFEVRLEVYHNGIMKFSDTDNVQDPCTAYMYSSPIDMFQWGLHGGDTLTFVLKVVDTATGATLGMHYLHGVVCGT